MVIKRSIKKNYTQGTTLGFFTICNSETIHIHPKILKTIKVYCTSQSQVRDMDSNSKQTLLRICVMVG